MAMRSNLPAVFNPGFRPGGMNGTARTNAAPARTNAAPARTNAAPARKANAVQTKMPMPTPLAPAKPMAPKVSMKPSDRPMGQASMNLTKPTAGVPPLPKMPSLNPKPAGAMARDTRAKRPKTGMK